MPIPPVTAVQRETISDRVTTALRDAILDGICTPGEQLSVATIASAFETTPPSVLPAFRRLTAIGLIEHGRGYRVIRPTTGQAVEASKALCLLTRALAPITADADTAIRAIRSLDNAGGRERLDDAATAVEHVCDTATNQALAALLRSHLPALIYRAQFATTTTPATAPVAA